MKNSSISAAVLFAATLGACGASAQAQGDKPAVVRLAPALDALVSPDARLQLVKGGFGFTEGIVWVEQGRYLLLSDIPANVIYKLTPGGRHLGTILTPELVANVEFGDPDHKTLYIAARTGVYKIRVNNAGIP
ncbi:MAG TPA: hypothetical protein VEL09_10385 [Burkholderiales bacterium]|nr:hypothetical protein [Burkholderiales bacterium]